MNDRHHPRQHVMHFLDIDSTWSIRLVVDTDLSLECMRLRSAPQTLPVTSMLHLNVAVHCPEFRTWGMRSSDTRVQYLKTTDLLGGRWGNLDWVSPELLSPVMSVCTPTDGGKTSGFPSPGTPLLERVYHLHPTCATHDNHEQCTGAVKSFLHLTCALSSRIQ